MGLHYKARDIQNKMVELKANVPGIIVGASPATNGEAEREARYRHPLSQHVKKCDQEI